MTLNWSTEYIVLKDVKEWQTNSRLLENQWIVSQALNGYYNFFIINNLCVQLFFLQKIRLTRR